MTTRDIDALWIHLRSLAVLREQGSYTAAAGHLGVSKAAISQRIAELERAAGVQLVRRTTRSVELTEAGASLVNRTQDAFEQIAAGFSHVRESAGRPSGLLRVTAPVAFARQQLTQHLPEFLRQYPEVRVELELSDEIRSLSREGFDLAVRHSSSVPDTHVASVLTSTRTILVASRAYLRRAGSPAHPEDLGRHACLFYPRRGSAPVWTFVPAAAGVRSRDAGQEVSVRVSGPLAVNNSEALRDAAMAGVGIALLPDFSAQSALQAGRLVPVLPHWQPVQSFGGFLYAVRPYSQHVPRAVAAFTAHLKQRYAKGFQA